MVFQDSDEYTTQDWPGKSNEEVIEFGGTNWDTAKPQSNNSWIDVAAAVTAAPETAAAFYWT